MRQRAALLRTVVQERPVLLLDEPFGALDALTRTDMQVWLSAVRARFDWTVVLVTHDIREAVFLADRVVVLGPRPTSVRREVTVDLPRPRGLSTITDPAFAAAEASCSPRCSGRDRGRAAPPRGPAEPERASRAAGDSRPEPPRP